MSDPRETRRKSKAALYQQGRVSPSLGANDPRTRRSAQARLTSELTGAYVRLDEQGRVTLDYDALRTQLQSDLNLSSDAAVTAAQLAGAYLMVSQDGALDVDFDALVADLGLRALAFQDDAPQDGTPYERQDGAWVSAAAGSGLADGDYGDVTVSGGGAAIAIDNNVVTFAKMQDLSAERLIGSQTAGDPIELSVAFPLSIKASALGINGVATVEVDLGSTAKFTGRFTITDANITASRVVQCWQAPGPYTGKGTRADEAEASPIRVVAVYPATGSAIVVWESALGFVTRYVRQNTDDRLAVNSQPQNVQELRQFVARLGAVRGNVKFSYMVS